MIVRSGLKSLGFKVEGANTWTQPPDQAGFIPAAKRAKAAIFANPSTLAALRPLAPIPIEIHLRRDADLVGQMHHNTASHIRAPLRETPLELEGFKQHSSAQLSGTRRVAAKKFPLLRRERPILGQFVGVPRPVHGFWKLPAV